MAFKIFVKFEGKLTCVSSIDVRNLANFHQGIWKSKIWDFDSIVMSKVENVWA